MRHWAVCPANPLLALAYAAAIGCSSSSSPVSNATPTAGGSDGGSAIRSSPGTAVCPRTGVILADVRDVERAGEGLVATTFGETSTGHKADWKYAGQVLGILKQVWGRSTTACTDFPADNAKRIDDAVAALDVAIPAMNQQSAVFAANAVGLAVVELFDYFHPDAPKEIVRMDAVFRQVGIDVHFGKKPDTKMDVDSLKTDWAAARPAVLGKVPTCHRVGGTATVVGDVEQSIANLDAAFAAGAAMTMEQESDNGAIEVDTLELLFDCPADNLKPESGLGSACTDKAKCDTGQVCDAAFGKCAPDPATAKIGIACTTTVDCGTDPRSACLTEAGDLYPGGYCGMEPCNDLEVCPPGATCVAIGGEAPGCYKTCSSDSDCRTADGYICQTFSTTPPAGFGPSSKACAFKCTEDAQCQPCKGAGSDQCQKLTCDVATGQCKP
jgi:hypothetical protein